MRWLNPSLAVAATILILGVGPGAHAAPAMFQASFIMHAWGNDVTTGASYPFNTSVFIPMPQGTTGCAPYYPYSSSYHPCLPASQRGKSATGTGSISVATTGTGPAPIALPQSAFGVSTQGFWPFNFPISYYTTYATFANDAGSFFKSGGPTTYSFTSSISGTTRGRWVIQPGPNRFGGKLGLLGVLGARWVVSHFHSSSAAHWSPDTFHWTPYMFSGRSSWNMIKAMGRGPDDPDHTYTNTGMFYNIYRTQTITYTAIGRGTLWTTGAVTVSVPLGAWVTIIRRAGHDTSTPGGVRNIQLVTPALIHWIGTRGQYDGFEGHIGILTLHVPEPHAVLLLAVGAGALVVLRRVSRRR
jgi:hypothetical protein